MVAYDISSLSNLINQSLDTLGVGYESIVGKKSRKAALSRLKDGHL